MQHLAQVGHGRGDKVDLGLHEGVISGVIMSPRDEGTARLERFLIDELPNLSQDYVALFDPQFYVSTLRAPKDSHLQDYDYYANNNGLSRTQFGASKVRKYVSECIDYQHHTLGDSLSYIVSPTVAFDDFRDNWSQIALNLAVDSIDYHSTLSDPAPLLISLNISERAMGSIDALEEFLDSLTALDTTGFYVVLNRSGQSTRQDFGAHDLAHFMYFNYVLAGLNEYDVVVGYTDWYSLLLSAVGVDFTASGWFQNLRHFNLGRYLPSGIKRRPNKRYSSIPLISSILITPELQDIYLAGLFDDVLSGASTDRIFVGDPASSIDDWKDRDSCIAHWHSLSQLSAATGSAGGIPSNLDSAGALIDDALSLYNHLNANGISFDPRTGPSHLKEYRQAISEFRSLTGI